MTERLCKNCAHMKRRRIGDITSVYWCELVGNGRKGTSIGIEPWRNKPHPKYPLGRRVKQNDQKTETVPIDDIIREEQA